MRRAFLPPLAAILAMAGLGLGGWLGAQTTARPEPDPRVGLTPEEVQWLRAHPVWRTPGSSSPPFFWMDEQGGFQGMGADYARLLESRLGIRIEPVPAPSWNASVEQLRRKECDISLLTAQTPDREVFLAFTESLVNLPPAVFTRVDNREVKSLADLARRRVAVVRSAPSHEWLQTSDTKMTLVPYEEMGGALSSVAVGETEAFVGNLASATFAIERLGVSNLKVVEQIPGLFACRVGVRRDWPEAVAILNKAIQTISPEEHAAIRRKWITLRDSGISWRKILLVAVPVAGAFVIVTLLLANRRLGKEVARRRQADAALKASEQRWSFALEGNRDGVWDWNVATNEIFFSKQFKAMLGYGEGDLEDRLEEWTRRIHPDDFPKVIEEVQRHLRDEVPDYQIEHRVQIKDNGYRWMLARGRVVERDATGKPLRMVGTHTDVTSWHEAEEMLRDSEQRYREIFDNTSDAIFSVEVRADGDFRYAAFNPANTRFLGRVPEELAGCTVDEAMPTAVVAQVKANYRRCIEAGDAISFEEQLDFPNGSGSFHTTLVPVHDTAGVIRRIIGISRDITENKRAEDVLRRHRETLEETVAARTAQLAQSEAQFRTLTDLVPNQVWSAGPDGQLDYVNTRSVEYFGRSSAELIGEGWQSIIHPDDLPGTVERWQHSLATGEPLHLEYRMRRADGVFRWHICRAQALRDPQGQIVKWFGTTTEIHEQKAVEQALHTAKIAAEEAVRVKSSFLAHMSHEIRTPMNAILGFTQLLLRDPAIGPAQRQPLEIILSSGDHLLALINDILEMSKIEAGHVRMVSEAFDLPRIFRDVETLFRARAEAKRLQLAFALAPDLPPFARADPGKLRQTLINLVGNAVKFTERGGVVVRTTTTGPNRERLVVEVEDTGPGIAPEEFGRLFQQFEQTAAGRNVQGGTGLGLALSREFARLMGGDITVRSEVGRGSTFRLEVAIEPCTEGPAAPAPTRRLVGLRPGIRPPRVLIADDARENRELLLQMLRSVGFETRQVANGAEAVEEFQGWRPQVILMDLRMPVMDGFEAIRRIRALPGGAEVRIIAVTASVFEDERESVLAGGADGFLPKPFRDEDLFEHLRIATSVEYVYAGDPVAAAAPSSAELDAETVCAVLPAELREQLRTAVVNADLDQILRLLEEAAGHDPAIAAALRQRAEAFDYPSLHRLLTTA